MLTGVALPLSEIPHDLIVPLNLGPRVHTRDGKPEAQFLFRYGERVLPFLQDDQLRIARWGTRRGESRALPMGGWTRLETFEGGGWGRWHPAEVLIPATLGLDRGVGYCIRQSVRGLLVRDEAALLRVYPLVEWGSSLRTRLRANQKKRSSCDY
jgi:hypothetical protein